MQAIEGESISRGDISFEALVLGFLTSFLLSAVALLAISLIYTVAAGSGSVGQLFVPGENSFFASKPALVLGPGIAFIFDMLGGYVVVSVARIRPYLHAVLLIGVLLAVNGAMLAGDVVYLSWAEPELTSEIDLWEVSRITLLLVVGVLAGAWLAVRRRSMT